ncbi:hypothetical protein [Pricia sp.]|uniref:hypothetical protein n=1 Tax=Pricia sp. TaxID=2268138 RepID=UPI003593319A
MKNTRLLIILGIAAGILSIPLVGMQFSDNVNWSGSDFLVMGILLLGTGLAIELALRKIPSTGNRLIVCGIIIVTLLVTWAELAVGIFGTPFAGS